MREINSAEDISPLDGILMYGFPPVPIQEKVLPAFEVGKIIKLCLGCTAAESVKYLRKAEELLKL